ncbi:MAG: transporter substrate-binding domain-containing protein [Drouetiella hepatica Uher 2000/2452]|uniref:Transporter substrate-binding domain-containing protein n=1 Tax=Drouetiella hepatica Uher 2000/2452 TaxID=904376 RepID=A0A951Q6Z0_9CYAN|nr:transporter substrate-binding domain-containing protein [Drouetiella hepatica Uher 2000/2452]
MRRKLLLKLLTALILVANAGIFAQTASAAELQEIIERGHLVVGVKDNLRPLAFRDAQGEFKGFEIDLARYLAQELLGDSEALVLKPLANSERLSAVLDGEVDVTIAQLATTMSRSRLVSFSTPYYLDGTAFLTHPSIQNFKDLQNQTIAVLNGSDTIAKVRSLFPNAVLMGVVSYQAAKDALDSGQATVFAADASVLTGWVQEDPRYALLPNLISAEPLAVALPRGVQYDELRRGINRAIDRWQTEGALRQQVINWGLPDAGVPRPANSPNFLNGS